MTLEEELSLTRACVFFSDVRQVPDNQEVFTHQRTDQSVIIEILEAADGTDEQAVR